MGVTVRIHSIKISSICDGPGIRMVIFFQGCSRGCEGCHNPETWDRYAGQVYSVEYLIKYIEDNAKTKRITLSGGEPLEQEAAVRQIVTHLRKKDYDIALYTGNQIEQIAKDILDQLNYVKTGEYKKELRTTTHSYVGSTNQKFFEIHRWEKYNDVR